MLHRAGDNTNVFAESQPSFPAERSWFEAFTAVAQHASAGF